MILLIKNIRVELIMSSNKTEMKPNTHAAKGMWGVILKPPGSRYGKNRQDRHCRNQSEKLPGIFPAKMNFSLGIIPP